MEEPKPMMRSKDDRQMRKALLPNLSMAAPKKGLAIAEMMYGIPKR